MFDVLQGLYLEGTTVLKTAVFLAGCAILAFIGLSFRNSLAKVRSGRSGFPIILTILLGQVVFSHLILSLIVFRADAHVKLAEGEVLGLLVAALLCIEDWRYHVGLVVILPCRETLVQKQVR